MHLCVFGDIDCIGRAQGTQQLSNSAHFLLSFSSISQLGNGSAEEGWRRRALTRAARMVGGVSLFLPVRDCSRPEAARPNGFVWTSAARTFSRRDKRCAEIRNRSCTACARPTPTSTLTRYLYRELFNSMTVNTNRDFAYLGFTQFS